jgi:hypothetical protein
MAFSPSSPVTGAPQTGLTSPTYTLVADQAPDINGKQFYVSALGGTQTGVSLHSASSPFTVTMWKPKAAKSLGVPNPVTGVIPSIPDNVYKIVVRKGLTPALGQSVRPAPFTLTMPVPAGADVYDAANIRAALSLLFGVAWAASTGIGDSTVTNTL